MGGAAASEHSTAQHAAAAFVGVLTWGGAEALRYVTSLPQAACSLVGAHDEVTCRHFTLAWLSAGMCRAVPR